MGPPRVCFITIWHMSFKAPGTGSEVDAIFCTNATEQQLEHHGQPHPSVWPSHLHHRRVQ